MHVEWRGSRDTLAQPLRNHPCSPGAWLGCRAHRRDPGALGRELCEKWRGLRGTVPGASADAPGTVQRALDIDVEQEGRRLGFLLDLRAERPIEPSGIDFFMFDQLAGSEERAEFALLGAGCLRDPSYRRVAP